ncbi:MAG: hypothetical protein DI582_10190 [Azospirillum brasilense]|nr:MAG: hypothetical protein DI582_10190 [Azospirillum brasilense]
MSALSAFSRSVDAMFGRLGMAATYRPVIGDTVLVTVIPKRPDEYIGLGASTVQAETVLFDVRASEVEAPRESDIVSYLGTDYRVIGEPRRDIHRLVWTLEAVAV